MTKRNRPRRMIHRPRLEGLESRALLTMFTVTNTNDSGNGSLRAAILASNAAGGTNLINFNIASSGVQTIAPASFLPAITTPVTIDGTTEPGYGSSPVIELDGSGAGGGSNGLTVASSGVTIKGLDVVRFSGVGISLNTPGGDTVASCYVGVDPTGSTAAPNTIAGVFINNSANNVIGGSASAKNVISGNTETGIMISGSGSTLNTISFDYIGVNAAGTAAVANGFEGISGSGATRTLVIRSVISGNSQGGILFEAGSTNVIASDQIGTDSAGATAIPNGSYGVFISGESTDFVGTSGAGNGNVISGNSGPGVGISGSTKTTVANSLIGLNRSASAALANTGDGVSITTSTGTTIGGPAGSGNFISGNGQNGVNIGSNASTTGTVVQGDDIGTDVTGALGIGNGSNGVQVNQASATIANCTIEANTQSGVLLFGGSGSVVRSNIIGDVLSGTHGNKLDGVFVYASSNNTIGGAGLGNIIGANTSYGIEIESDLTDNPHVIANKNVVLGNFVGLNGAGGPGRGNGQGIAVFDATGTTIGGTAAGSSNFIGSNAGYGIDIHGTDSTSTLIQGNVVGLAAAATSVPAPNAAGILLDGAAGVLILSNFVSDNTGDGIVVNDGSGSVIQSNLIGTDFTGRAAAGNGGDGIDVLGATGTTIGGAADPARNTIAANGGYGIQIGADPNTHAGGTGNLISADWLGVSADGMVALGNGHAGTPSSGIWINNAGNNTIGGSTQSHNVIANSGADGIIVTGANSNGTIIVGNFVGVAPDGVTPGGNALDGILIQGVAGVNVSYDLVSDNTDYGVQVANGSTAVFLTADTIGTTLQGNKAAPNGVIGVLLDNVSGNFIGGTQGILTRNVISGNGQYGIWILGTAASGNTVEGNYIGTDLYGQVAVPNGNDGVLIQGPSNVIGGTSAAAGNVVSGNGFAGIDIRGQGTGNVVANNFIGTNASGSALVRNNYYGVYIDGSGSQSASKNVIGLGASTRNVIAGGGIANISVLGPLSSGTLIAGNMIGTNAAGTLGLGLTPFGIVINGSPTNTVGGAAAGAGNLIGASSQDGLAILNGGASANLAQGNQVGPPAGGSASLANAVGILISNAPNNTIGGAAAGAANTITGNGTNPIQVTGSGATGNQTTGNNIGS